MPDVPAIRKEVIRKLSLDRSPSNYKIMLPPESVVTLDEAIHYLIEHKQQQEQEIGVDTTLDIFYQEGLVALARVLVDRFGYLATVPDIDPFTGKPIPPSHLEVPVRYGEKQLVVTGLFRVPGADGVFRALPTDKGLFRLVGKVRRKHASIFEEMRKLIESKADVDSIFRGQFLLVTEEQNPNSGEWQAGTPTFLPVPTDRLEDLVLPLAAKVDLEARLFNPLLNLEIVRKAGIPINRKLVLGGPFGCGKTMTMALAAKLGVASGYTVIQVRGETLRRPEEMLQWTVEFARRYQHALILWEDVDTLLGGVRDDRMNIIVNTMSGVLGNDAEVILVGTTNNQEAINPVALRPGRVDSLIYLGPPDAAAAARLVTIYARGRLSPTVDLDVVGKKFEGKIPAMIQVACTWAREYAVARALDHTALIETEDLMAVADKMTEHMKLVDRPAPVERTWATEIADALRGRKPSGEGHEAPDHDTVDAVFKSN